MAVTRHKHPNGQVFQVATDDGVTGSVHLVTQHGLLQPSSTNPAPVLTLPLADEPVAADLPPEPTPEPQPQPEPQPEPAPPETGLEKVKRFKKAEAEPAQA